MVVTEAWLVTKNGQTIVLDAKTAKKQSKKKRNTKRKANSSGGRQRKKARVDWDQDTSALQSIGEEDGDAEDPNAQLFADAQSDLMEEMAAAGFGGELPLSFGSTKSQPARSSKKRRRVYDEVHDTTPVGAEDPVKQPSPVVVEHVPTPAVVEKFHVKYDSDGEVVERSTEVVELPTEPTPSESFGHNVVENDENGLHNEPAAENGEEPPVTPPEELDQTVLKFWKQRRTLFYQYDDGIHLDHESWYSVTPQAIAEHIAQRCACDVIVDPFSGCGGNIIQFAKTCRQVIAIEIDPEKIRMAQHNARIYGVADRIEWINGDATEILPKLKADVVFLSPPWGGMNYNRNQFDIDKMLVGDTTGTELFQMARSVAPNVVYYMPKTTPVADLEALSPDEIVECEHLHLNGQLKVVNAYYGELVQRKTIRDESEMAEQTEEGVQVDETQAE
ncbi:hypothetical protein Poli38472_003952 [Pythium oligandrum]|uniref:Trimethylguanosine synthase n=1 Tax=Pythium oligandrum TaxID=41045 RepID=A0A8K1CMC9_PYTOL|nr:hypothetical protein Poli38472_003952 [Pythium oligandrum]|eukprot:TMW66187.1 hypothetical protein Poli38472_003952 [Pythium oligandrum]